LRDHVTDFPNDLRWFSELREGVDRAIVDCGMAKAESADDALAATRALLTSLDALFTDIPNLIQREVGLPEQEMPPPPAL